MTLRDHETRYEKVRAWMLANPFGTRDQCAYDLGTNPNTISTPFARVRREIRQAKTFIIIDTRGP